MPFQIHGQIDLCYCWLISAPNVKNRIAGATVISLNDELNAPAIAEDGTAKGTLSTLPLPVDLPQQI